MVGEKMSDYGRAGGVTVGSGENRAKSVGRD